MSYSGSTMWGDEISEISYTSGGVKEGVTPRRVSSIRIDYVEDSASSSSWTTLSEIIEVESMHK